MGTYFYCGCTVGTEISHNSHITKLLCAGKKHIFHFLCFILVKRLPVGHCRDHFRKTRIKLLSTLAPPSVLLLNMSKAKVDITVHTLHCSSTQSNKYVIDRAISFEKDIKSTTYSWLKIIVLQLFRSKTSL
jgi:hypothetical protein